MSSSRTAEDNKHCTDLKNHLQSYNVDGFMKSMSELYRSLHPDKNDTVQPEAMPSTLSKMFEHCGISTQTNEILKRPMPDNTEKVETIGTLELRTVNYTAGNFVMKTKVGIKRTSCLGVRSILKMLGTENFDKMYGVDEKILVLSIIIHSAVDPVIPEWFGIVYKGGEIVEAKQHAAKCIEQDEFKDLKYKEKHVKDHVVKA